MASNGFEHSRLPTVESQPFVTGYNQDYQLPAIGLPRNGLSPVIRQVAQERQERCNFGCEYDGSHQMPSLQRVISYMSWRRRGKSDSCDSLRQIFCWVIVNVVLTCAIVIGLLFLLKYVNSPLLRSEGHSDLTETGFFGNSAQKACGPCSGSEQNDENASKLPNCCTINQEALKKMIEKMTKETISTQLSSTAAQQGSVSGGRERSTVGQVACGAFFFLTRDGNVDSSTTTQKPGDYSILRGWNHHDGNVAYMTPCISYNKSTGEVTINQTGYYVVYSHLAFKWEKSKDPIAHPSIVLGQKIIVEIAKVVHINEPIASDRRAAQPNDPLVGDIPSYNSRTMTIVQLHRGTKLTVHAKPSELVMRDNSVSSFGLYRL